MVAGLETRLDPPFLGVEAELGEPSGFEGPRLPFLELGERAASPQGERLAQRVRRPVGFAQLEELMTPTGECLELTGVDRVAGRVSR